MQEQLAQIFKLPENQVRVIAPDEGAARVRGVPDKRMTISEIFKAKFGSTVGSMFGGHCFKTEGGLNPKTGKGKAAAFWFFSACGAEVEVDIDRQGTRIARGDGCGRGKSDSSAPMQPAE